MGSAETPWILSRNWDLGLLIGSIVLIPLLFLLQNGLGIPASLVSLISTILIIGPHLFATFTYTAMERYFWLKHPYYATGALFLPVAVIFLGVRFFPLLIAIAFFWASLHILHQVCYLADCYQARQDQALPRGWRRAIDYAVVFTSFYPVVSYRLLKGTLDIAGQGIRIPHVQGNPLLFITVSSLFIVSLLLYVAKAAWEWRRGTICLPKTLLIFVSVVASLFLSIPKDLDVAFLGINVWHSLQYLAIAWWINCLRKERKEISSPFVQSISGWTKTPLFYVSCIVPTLGAIALVAALTKLTNMPFNQCSWIVILAGLTAHYYLDHWVFTRVDAVI